MSNRRKLRRTQKRPKLPAAARVGRGSSGFTPGQGRVRVTQKRETR